VLVIDTCGGFARRASTRVDAQDFIALQIWIRAFEGDVGGPCSRLR
jgi:hypothetical protein